MRDGRRPVLHRPGLSDRAEGRTRARRSSPSCRACSRRRRRARCSAPSGATAIAAGIDELTEQRRRGAGRRPARRRRPRYAFAPHAAARVGRRSSWPRPHALQTEAFGTVNTGRRRATTSRRWRTIAARAGGQPHRLHLQRHHRQGRRRRTRAWSRRAARARSGRLLNDKMPTGVAVSPAMNHGGPYPGDRPPRLHRGRHSGVAAPLRRAALLRQRPPAPPAARARGQEPDGQDVAAHRRRVVAAGRRSVTASERPLETFSAPASCSRRRAPRRAARQGGCRSRAEMLLTRPSGDLFGMTQNAGMGWNPAELGARAVPDPQHAGRPARRRRHADRARLSHRALGGRPAGARRRPRSCARWAACRSPAYCHRSVRRPHAGHDGHVRQPAVPQRRGDRLPPADPLAADARGVLGVATCDKGLPAMMMALAGARDLPGVLVPGGVTLPPTTARTRARCSRSARATRTARSRSRRPPSWAAAPAARRAAAASSWARRRRRRWSPRRSGMSLPHSALAPSGQPIWLDMARRSARALLRAGSRAACTLRRS